MANVGTAAAGKVLIGAGNGASPTYANIGTNSGLTAHGVIVGEGNGAFVATAAGTAGQVLQSGGASADPVYSTATYPSTATGTGTILRADGTNWSATTSTYPNTNAINTLLYASSANVMSALATANNGVLTTGTSGIPVITALASDGQLIIGSSAGAPAAATISAGTGITVTNGNNTITISVSSGGFTWTDVSGAFSPLKENGYFVTATATGTLPASPSQGDTIKFFVDTTQLLTIQATAGKIIRFGSLVSSSGGTFVSTLQGDSVELVYRTSDTCWCAIAGFTGTWNLT